jgi:hypothetical protein
MRMGRFLLPLVFFLGMAVAGAMAKPAPSIITVNSPDVGKTWNYGRLLQWSFQLDRSTQSLTVIATYTNDLLADRENPVTQDDLWFRFPAAHYDAASHAYLLKIPAGKKGKTRTLVVARRNSGFFQNVTRLAPNAMVLVTHSGTRVSARLVVDASGGRMPLPFYEIVHGGPYTLQSLITP